MTKKDYQALAGALYDAKTVPYPDVVSRIADVLAADNPRFDRECFVAACEDGNVGRRPSRSIVGDKSPTSKRRNVECGSCSQYHDSEGWVPGRHMLGRR